MDVDVQIEKCRRRCLISQSVVGSVAFNCEIALLNEYGSFIINVGQYCVNGVVDRFHDLPVVRGPSVSIPKWGQY